MNIAEFGFKIVDDVMDKPQNRDCYAGIKAEKDKVYRSEFPDECIADYYYKDNALTREEKSPVMLYIHGGGFVKGDKKYRRSFSEMVASEGYFVFNADHRLCPKHIFPAMVEDGIYMLNKIGEIADEYNLDLNKIVICGDSSGAYVSSMVVACTNDPELSAKLNLPKCNVKVSGFIGLCAPYDVVRMITKTFPKFFVRSVGESLLGMKLKSNFSNIKDFPLYDYLSPLNFVHDNWCPSLVIYSKSDLFCPKQAEPMLEKMRKHNVDVTEFYATKLLSNHCFHLMTKTKDAQEANRYIKDFLKKIDCKA